MGMDMTRQERRKKHPRMVTTRGERWAWYFYDFGNSAYAAVVLLAVYSIYFKESVVGGAKGTWLWGVSIGIAMLVVAVLSPLLGALADFSSTKKRLLAIFTAMACVFTALLFFVGKGDIFLGMLFFILAEIGYRSGQVFYNALLPDIATPEEMGHVSGTGWAIGSMGGIVCLLIVLALILGIGGNLITRIAFLITAVFYALSTAPLFIFLRERTRPQRIHSGENYILLSIKKLVNTFKNARKFKDFMNFLLAFLVYNHGIMIALDFAAIIGKVLFKLDQKQLIVFMIIVQVTSVIGAYVFGKIAHWLGSKWTMIIAVFLMIITVSLLFFVDSLTVFYIIGALAGFALTAVQSVSRTVVGQLAPEENAAEFYGLFSLASQISNFIGPALYGVVVLWLSNLYMKSGLQEIPAEQHGQRIAVSIMVLFLTAGMLLLLRVKSWKRPESEFEHGE
jgi:UMF1 family MFS transporter